jgi:hypothetical protein
MSKKLRQSLSIIGILILAGCSSTPMTPVFTNHFNQTSQSEEHVKCMKDNAMFNNRQLMVAPSAVENAWGYCLNQFGVIAPGQTEDETIVEPWADDEK